MSDFFATPWTVALQTSLSMVFSRKEYWNELLFPLPGNLPDPGIEPWSLDLHADLCVCVCVCVIPTEPPRKSHYIITDVIVVCCV